MIMQECDDGRKPEVWEITENAPYKIPGARIFQSTFSPEKDPMPYSQWVLYDGKLHAGERIIDVLKECRIFPKTDKEANDIANLIIYAHGDRIFEEPKIAKKDGYYEIKAVLLERPMRAIKINIDVKIGENVYEMKEEKVYPL